MDVSLGKEANNCGHTNNWLTGTFESAAEKYQNIPPCASGNEKNVDENNVNLAFGKLGNLEIWKFGKKINDK